MERVVNSAPGLPLADLVLIAADLPVGGSEAFFHDPSGSCDPDQLSQAGWFGCPAAVEGQFTGGLVASDKQAVSAFAVRVVVGADVGKPGLV